VSDTWRCFVALPAGDPFRRAFSGRLGEWQRRPDLAGLRWSQPEAWHVTIGFLGDVPPTDVPRVLAALRAAGRPHQVAGLSTSGVGGFPSSSRARVVWCGVADPSGELSALADAVRGALALGTAEPFRAHVTLARARSLPVDLRGWVADALAPEVPVPVDRIELMRSHLGHGPARYEALGSVRLGVPAGV
jgi:RNA 2',3'-cyclic 3'-phosphodiesterase